MKKLLRFRKNENPKSTEFTKKLNAIIQDVERANNIKISVEGNAKGSTISNKRGHNFIIRVPKKSRSLLTTGTRIDENPSALPFPSEEDVGIIRRAKTSEDAGGGDSILCSFFNEKTGEIIETPGTGITVNCLISNGSALNEASRRLEKGDELFVTASAFDNDGIVEFRWMAIEGFMGTEECDCT